MKRNKLRRTSKAQQISLVGDQTDSDALYEDAISKATADYYELKRKSRTKDRWLDIWIGVGVYLVLSSLAFVILSQ